MLNQKLVALSPLFKGIEENQLDSLLNCLGASWKNFKKDEFVLRAGDRAELVGIVLSGGVRVVQDDFWGRRMILTHIKPGELFGEAFACAGKQQLPVSVVAAEASAVMLIDYHKIISTCPTVCGHHAQLVMNMIRILAEKNIALTRKMEHLGKRSTREKLLSFLSAQAVKGVADGGSVKLPFNRQELADYLCVDRSALSRELGAMQDEGLISYDKNHFELLRPQKR